MTSLKYFTWLEIFCTRRARLHHSILRHVCLPEFYTQLCIVLYSHRWRQISHVGYYCHIRGPLKNCLHLQHHGVTALGASGKQYEKRYVRGVIHGSLRRKHQVRGCSIIWDLSELVVRVSSNLMLITIEFS